MSAPDKTSSATNKLGGFFDQQMNFECHIKEVVKSCFVQLRTVFKIKAVLSFQDVQKIIHVFISSHLDQCYSLFTTLSSSSASLLLLVQNVGETLFPVLTSCFFWIVCIVQHLVLQGAS